MSGGLLDGQNAKTRTLGGRRKKKRRCVYIYLVFEELRLIDGSLLRNARPSVITVMKLRVK